MNSSNLKQLLTQYERKKAFEEKEAEERKQKLFEKEPSLQQIEDELKSLAFSTTKSLINSNDPVLLKNLESKIESLKIKKELALKKLGLPSDYLLPNYSCKVCKDTGYITNLDDYTTSMCNCLKQKLFDIEYNKSNISNLKFQTFENFSSFYYSDKVDEKKYNIKISPRENIIKIKEICINFVNNFDNFDEKNLLFTGNTGLGKTFLSSAIANQVIKLGKNVLYQTAPNMLDSILDYRFGKSTSESNIYNNLLTADLLIIDDLGTESMNSLKFTELFNIINTRLLNQNHITKTIISTNLSLKNLYDTYDERIVSRIVGNYNICYFFGDDIRFKLRNNNKL